jgi:SAM-dependent methyltransferase
VSGATALTPLIGAASAYYRRAGRFAVHFARSKLKHDPAYRTILGRGLLAGHAHVLDLGCGQGLLGAWLLAARAYHAAGGRSVWPHEWPAPPLLRSYRGVDINRQEVRRARQAFAFEPGIPVQIEHADICEVEYTSADAIVILDVLHYLDHAAQERVLQRVRGALAPDGLLLLRIGDAGGGLGHSFGKALDHTVALLRRGRWVPLKCRALADWQQLLSHCGFVSRSVPLIEHTAFVNVLLRAQVA